VHPPSPAAKTANPKIIPRIFHLQKESAPILSYRGISILRILLMSSFQKRTPAFSKTLFAKPIKKNRKWIEHSPSIIENSFLVCR
jgi:hypothetical protein